MTTKKMTACPCGEPNYEKCCGQFLSREKIAPTAVALMRSRYSAYVLQNAPYLRDTWHPSTVPTSPIFDDGAPVKWLGLDVLDAQEEGDAAMVEFVARYKINGRAEKIHERSRFVRQQGQWLYIEGIFLNATDIR